MLHLGVYVCSLALLSAPQPIKPVESVMPIDVRMRAEQSIKKALALLESQQQSDGGWEAFGSSHIGVSALVLKCFLQDEHYGPNHRTSQRAIDFVKRFVQPDGGIYEPSEGHRNYHTSVAVMALSSARESSLDSTVKKAVAFLKDIQWDAGEGHERSSPWYGGQGYGGGKRPDLSNTQMMLEALHDSGLPSDDPAYQKALVFISRSQMLDKTNDQAFAKDGGDGGFIYSPANGGESKAGTEIVDDKPRLRSYGSMTYAGFKSLLYANVDRDDERVRRAVDWIRRTYTLDENPNMPGDKSQEGLYYYYHVFARAMYAWGEDPFVDAHGNAHRWRVELCEKLMSLQQEDGSWVNEKDRWFEGNPSLVTAYSVLALQTALAK